MKTFAAVCLILGVIGGLWGQWCFGHQMVVFGCGLYILAPIFAMLALIALFSIGRQVIRLWLTPTFIVLCITSGGFALSWIVGDAIHSWQYRRVLSYVISAHQRLDDERVRGGHYPTVLPADLAAALPTWLRERDSYRSDGDHFTFSYSDPAGMMFSGMTYSSIDRQWHYED
jgi:hypothetical protein